MYELREFNINFFGVYLLISIIMLALLSTFNINRFKSLISFWKRTNINAELNKPISRKNSFSILSIMFRSLACGLLVSLIFQNYYDIEILAIDIFKFSSIFIAYWVLRSFIELSFLYFIDEIKILFKIFHIRSLLKEKISFLTVVLLCILSSVEFPKIGIFSLGVLVCLGIIVIHINTFKLYFRINGRKKLHIILYICASEIAPIWILLQIFKL